MYHAVPYFTMLEFYSMCPVRVNSMAQFEDTVAQSRRDRPPWDVLLMSHVIGTLWTEALVGVLLARNRDKALTI